MLCHRPFWFFCRFLVLFVLPITWVTSCKEEIPAYPGKEAEGIYRGVSIQKESGLYQDYKMDSLGNLNEYDTTYNRSDTFDFEEIQVEINDVYISFSRVGNAGKIGGIINSREEYQQFAYVDSNRYQTGNSFSGYYSEGIRMNFVIPDSLYIIYFYNTYSYNSYSYQTIRFAAKKK